MKITILGSGSFHIDKDHSAPAYLLEIKDKKILLDCGPGTLVQMAKIGFDPYDLDYIFLTHFHADHSSDLFPLLMRGLLGHRFYGRELKKNLQIIGPKGMKDFVVNLCNIYRLYFLKDFDKYEYQDFEPNMKFNQFTVGVFPVNHLETDANALRIESAGKIIAYTGDAEKCDGVIKASQNADLLIADATNPNNIEGRVHMNTTQVGEVAKESSVKKVVLAHQMPVGFNVDMVSQTKEVFNGEVVLAKDLMEINL